MRGAVTNSLKRFCLSTNFICKILSLSRSWSFRNETSNQGTAPVNPLCIHFRNPVHPGFLIRASLVTQTVKNLPVTQETKLSPWLGKIPWGREWQPTPIFLPGEFHGQRRLADYGSWCCKELDTTAWLSLSLSSSIKDRIRLLTHLSQGGFEDQMQ